MNSLITGSVGLIFIELYTLDIPASTRLFTDVFRFSVVQNEEGFIGLRSPRAIVLLNDGHDLPPGHRFQGRITGHDHGDCVEIGLVVDDLEATRQRAMELGIYQVTDIVLQDWGMRDFRILTKEGFYLRVTEPFD
jgi:catechol 2,3-dioxygenase-like lactoylglutathione lyase family enzyme